MFKSNNKKNRKASMKSSVVFIVNFEDISDLSLKITLLTSNK